jgi:hypothetical protein
MDFNARIASLSNRIARLEQLIKIAIIEKQDIVPPHMTVKQLPFKLNSFKEALLTNLDHGLVFVDHKGNTFYCKDENVLFQVDISSINHDRGFEVDVKGTIPANPISGHEEHLAKKTFEIDNTMTAVDEISQKILSFMNIVLIEKKKHDHPTQVKLASTQNLFDVSRRNLAKLASVDIHTRMEIWARNSQPLRTRRDYGSN